MNRKTQITIETHSITIIRTNSRRFAAHCEHCGETVTAFALEQIADALQVNLAEVCRRIETKQIHLIRTERSAALICGNSLEGKKIN